MDILRALFAPNIVWHAPGRSQLAGDHQGVDAVLGYFGRTMELTGGSFQVEVHAPACWSWWEPLSVGPSLPATRRTTPNLDQD
jgi:hypothetical protein